MTDTKAQAKQKQVRKILWIVFVLNLVVAAAKFLYGLYSGSSAMQADGIHSVFDSVGNIVGLIGVSIALRPPDEEHPYGHTKFETYGSIIIGILLLFAAYEVGSGAVSRLISGEYTADVSVASFVVMALTLAINICVTLSERSFGKKLSSEILLADASHTLSDVLVSLGVIVGLAFVACGFPAADPITALIVTACILASAVGVFSRGLKTLSDTSRIPYEEISRVAYSLDEVKQVHNIRTRGTESSVYCDLHLLVDPGLTVEDAHTLSDELEARLKQAFPQIVEVLIHVEPYNEAEIQHENLPE